MIKLPEVHTFRFHFVSRHLFKFSSYDVRFEVKGFHWKQTFNETTLIYLKTLEKVPAPSCTFTIFLFLPDNRTSQSSTIIISKLLLRSETFE